MALFKFDHMSEPMLSHTAFAGRMLVNIFAAAIIIGLALAGGMYGYHTLEGLSWLDSFLNASMLLGGMGPVGDIPTESGKLFASFYALYAGLVFIASAGVLLAPVLHRLMHSLHLESGRAKDDA